MKRVTIGVHVYAEPRRLAATLASIAANTAIDCDILLLADGPEADVHNVFSALPVACSGSDEPAGAPVCFNRLLRETSTPVVVFLESGVVVAAGWLDRLLAALDADPRNALAGPSTNRAWNEQCVFPAAREEDTMRTAEYAALRFGDSCRSLAPLYSLGDFCFAALRKAVDAVGGAEEAYGRGPCWEMDINVRAARAGWRALWVCGAYVYRPLPPIRRQRDEALLFERSRHLYQDRFCGARLRGEKYDYRAHCRGDACPNFAPLPPARAAEATPHCVILVDEGPPLVTCIMPTHNRRDFISDAIRTFQRQDYEPRELVVVDDGGDCIADLIPEDERIRYIRSNSREPIGVKRNRACDEAHGELIAHWDDDDWYPTWRLTAEVRALRERRADLCGSTRLHFHDAAGGRAWEYRYPPASGWLAGTTLLYTKAFWSRNRFPPTSFGEDAAFVGARVPKSLHDLADSRLCIARIHPGNCATRPEGPLWHPIPEREVWRLMDEDSEDAMPLMSCIMPTRNRRRFLPLALDCFAAQTYPQRELLVIDDGDDPVEDLVTGVPNVSYVRVAKRVSIGRKRNLAVQHARGEVVVHWDDDDWYGPERLREQIAPILAGQAELTAYGDTIVFDALRGAFWSMLPHVHQRVFYGNVHGGTIAWRRILAQRGLRYPEVDLAEDAMLLRQAAARGYRLQRLPNDGSFVYVRHGSNVWREFSNEGWLPITRPPQMRETVAQSYLVAATSSL